MANKDVSIVFKASDRLSAAVKGMRTNVKGLQADVEAFGKKKDNILGDKAEVKLNITKAKQSLKDLEKEIKKGSKEAEVLYKKQYEALEMLNDELATLTKRQKEADKAGKELSETLSKSSNASGRSGVLGSLATAGLGSMLGNAAGDLMGQEVSSIFGSAIGNAVGNIGSNVLSGAALGSIAGPIGTAVGAAVGGLTGAIQSLTDYNSQKDETFRTEVQSLYTDAVTDMENKVTSGSGYAAEREMYRRNYASMTDGTMGAELYKDIMAYGDATPYDTSVMLSKGMEMLSYGVEAGSIMEMMDMVGNIAMGNTEKFSGLSYAISQSMNAGTLNGQDRRQMIGWGFDPLEFISQNLGIDMGTAKDMMSAGQITSEMLVDAMRTATGEGGRFHNATMATADTYTGMKGQLESAQKNIDIAMGEGYNEKRKEGMAAELEAYNGELGAAMKDAYSMVGAYEAELENQYQQSIINAMQEATERIEKEGLTGIEAEKAMWEAKTQAEIDYKNSEEYMMKLEAEKGLVEKIQQTLTEERTYVDFGYEMSQQFTEGFQDGVLATMKNEGFWAGIDSIFAGNYQKTGGVNGHATGLQYVPYDGYIAKLHEGERVLTRQEARQSAGKSVTIAKLADQIIVREDADIDKIGAALVAKLMDAQENYAGV